MWRECWKRRLVKHHFYFNRKENALEVMHPVTCLIAFYNNVSVRVSLCTSSTILQCLWNAINFSKYSILILGINTSVTVRKPQLIPPSGIPPTKLNHVVPTVHNTAYVQQASTILTDSRNGHIANNVRVHLAYIQHLTHYICMHVEILNRFVLGRTRIFLFSHRPSHNITPHTKYQT